VLATLERKLCLGLACCALQSQDNLLGGLGLLVEDRLGLTTVTGLLTVVTTLTLGEEGGLASLVLGDLVLGVLLAVSALAVSAASLGNVDLKSATLFSMCSRGVLCCVMRRVWFLQLSVSLSRG